MNVVNKSLVDAEEEVIAHGCNCSGGFGSGVAKAIAQKWPNVSREYFKHYKNRQVKLGEVQLVNCGNKIVANLFTQQFYGKSNRRYVDYDAVESSFGLLIDWMVENEKKTLAIPMVGAGLGRGDWSEICDRIDKANNNRVNITVYYLQK